MEQSTMTQYKSVNLTIYFNADLDDGEVQDFIDRMTDKYNHTGMMSESSMRLCHLL